MPLRVPRVRDRSAFPTLLAPRPRAERALVAVVQEAYIQGVSTRRVQALGMSGIAKSPVSRLCQELDGVVERCRSRRLDGPDPYLWRDATFVTARQDGTVVSVAVVIAVDVYLIIEHHLATAALPRQCVSEDTFGGNGRRVAELCSGRRSTTRFHRVRTSSLEGLLVVQALAVLTVFSRFINPKTLRGDHGPRHDPPRGRRPL